MNPDIKKQAQKIFAHPGMDLTTAVNVFLQQAITCKGFPSLMSNPLPESFSARNSSNG